ncbi:hypothetical protein NECAME_01088, partial [Necator americanus]
MVINLEGIKQECEDVEENQSANDVTHDDTSLRDTYHAGKPSRKRRPLSRPKKIRPRAGRRTGERVTSDEELPSEATGPTKSMSSPHNFCDDEIQSDKPNECDVDDFNAEETHNDDFPLFEEKCEVPSERSSAETDKGSPTDGLYIDEEAPVDERIERNLGQNRSQVREIPIRQKEVKDEPASADDNSDTVVSKPNYDTTETGKEIIDENQDSGLLLQHQYRRKFMDHTIDPSIGYRYRMWSHAYRTFRTNPFIVPPARGQVPQLVRYPRRPVREVRSVTRDDKCYVKLGVKYEVAVSNPPK